MSLSQTFQDICHFCCEKRSFEGSPVEKGGTCYQVWARHTNCSSQAYWDEFYHASGASNSMNLGDTCPPPEALAQPWSPHAPNTSSGLDNWLRSNARLEKIRIDRSSPLPRYISEKLGLAGNCKQICRSLDVELRFKVQSNRLPRRSVTSR